MSGPKTELFSKIKTSFGLDINLNGLRVMELDSSGKSPMVNGYGSIELSPNRLATSLDNSDGFLESKINELLSDKLTGFLSSNYAVISIPAARTFSQALNIPTEAEKQLQNMIDIEIEQYVPMPKDLLEIDWEIVSRTKQELGIALTSVPKKLVDRVLEATRATGIEPILVEPSTNSIARALAADESGDLNTIIVDIGLTNTDIAILDQTVRATSSIPIGGNDFTLSVANKLNISLEKAYQLKVLRGFNKSKNQASLTKALTPDVNRIIREIKKIIRYNNDRLQNREIQQILLVGTGSNLAGLGEFLTNELLMPIRIASPWQNINFRSLEKPKRAAINRYLTVSGAALLTPTEIL